MSNLVKRLEKLESKAFINDSSQLNMIIRFVSKENQSERLHRLATDTSESGCRYDRLDSEAEDAFQERAFTEHRLRERIKNQHGALLFQRFISSDKGEK